MSKIKYVSSSGLTHYDEKIKKVINKVDTSTNTKVTQTPTSSNETYPLLLSPTGQTSEVNTTSYFNSDVVLNPSTKTISANIDGNAETATKAVQDGDGNTITTTYVKETPEFTESTERNNIESKESMSTILGKVKKYFTDLKSHAFNALANNLTTTTEGYALDATQGKALQDKIGSTDISAIGDGTTTGAISSLNSNLNTKMTANSWKTFSKRAMSGGKLLVLVADITRWYNSQYYVDFTGIISSNRQHWYGNAERQVTICYASVGYSSSSNKHRLYTTNSIFRPVIVKYTNQDNDTDIKYYLALLRSTDIGSGQDIEMLYSMQVQGGTHNGLMTCIPFDNSLTLPDGYTMEKDDNVKFIEASSSGSIKGTNGSYTYDSIKALEDRISVLESK